MDGRGRIIAALDVASFGEARTLVDRLGTSVGFYKVGLELYLAEGPSLLDWVADRGRLFLDLKLHDIPETVARATMGLRAPRFDLLTIHASGGREMMRRAADAAHARGARVLAVTVLTSLDEQDLAAEGYGGAVGDLALRRAELAAAAGCDGVVASPLEVAALRRALPPPFLIVTPGVRPAGQQAGDQKRVATPRQAIEDGADLLVVGRPLRDAPDPAAAARAIAAELDG